MVEILVPATTANLGPGFDVLGLSLNLYNRFTVDEREDGVEIEVAQPDAPLPLDERNLVVRSARRLFDEVGYAYRGLRVRIDIGVPLGRGLGSSSTAIVGGLAAANVLSGANLSKTDLFALAAEIEGHPDNVGPAIFGGLTICYTTDAGFGAASYTPADALRPILLIPASTLETKRARAVLPERVSLPDAVFNIGRSSLLVCALLSGRADLLSVAMQDRLHQPYRAPLIPGLTEILQRVGELDGVGVALSGAGPSVVCIAEKAASEEVYGHIARVLTDISQPYSIVAAEFDLDGVRVADVVDPAIK